MHRVVPDLHDCNMERNPESDGRYHYDSVPIKRENIGRAQDRPASSDYPYPREAYQRGDYPAKSRWDSTSAYEDRQSSHYRRDEKRDYRFPKEDYLSGKVTKLSREYRRDSPESSKSRHKSHPKKRHREGSSREPERYEPDRGSDASPISKKIYYKNREIAKVPPMPQRRLVKKEPGDDGIEVLEISDNKTRTRLRRMNKQKGESDKPCEVVTLPSDSPKATSSDSYFPQSEPMQNSWTPRISVVPGDQLAVKFEEEVMIPEEEVARNLSETGAFNDPASFNEPAPPMEPQYYRSQEENVPYEEYREIPPQNYEELDRKPFQANPYVPPVVQMETAPIAEVVEQSYNRSATCSRCNMRLLHECRYPNLPDPRSSSLSPGKLYTCQCSLNFLHTSECVENIEKGYVLSKNETGLIKQVDRIHVYECHDCTFKFSLQGLKNGNHHFESLTRKDGQLRERGKRHMSDLKPMLKHIDAISRQRYPNEPPSVQDRHVEIRRCLVCHCSQGCCFVYHDCPPKPSSAEEPVDEDM